MDKNPYYCIFPTTKFYKKIIRSKIQKGLSYKEARRLHEPIYDALIRELFEASCFYTAKQFIRLSEKEKCLKDDLIINTQLKDKRTLLYSLFDKCLTAEVESFLERGKRLKVTFGLLYECIILLEEHRHDFEWLLEDVFSIVIRLCERLDNEFHSAYEEKCLLYYKYGMFLIGKDLAKSIHYLDLALELACTNNWQVRNNEALWVPMHTEISKNMSNILLRHGFKLMLDDINVAQKVIQKVVLSLALVGTEMNRTTIVRSNALLIECYLENQKFSEASNRLNLLKKYVNDNTDAETSENVATLNYLTGIVLINSGHMEEAYKCLRNAFVAVRKFDLKVLEANILLRLGIFHSQKLPTYALANQNFQEAQNIFQNLGAIRFARKAFYLSIATQVKQIFPKILDSVKDFSTVKMQRYNLLHWKHSCRPFWDKEVYFRKRHQEDELFFLLEENRIPKYKFVSS